MNENRPEFNVVAYVRAGDDDENVSLPPTARVEAAGYVPPAGAQIVIAVADVGHRWMLIEEYVHGHGLRAADIVHPRSIVDRAAIRGTGNIIGPWCYLGAGAVVGSFNVINYHCTIGHHSRVGSNNFLAPDFNCGNSVTIGDRNFFGISCTVAPGVTVGDSCIFQAGLAVFEDLESDYSYFSPPRIKSVKSLKEMK
ncbi:DapH/DapD/GlmU-related protein [Nocardia asteroides]|uniref:DapH/DapD/GlmU-related protein n=1 Tax=Nocardia asteroides TaxID=1824 RepID=UPI001E4233CA|nr:DapH/DapD/GlmU-related protein [Nocardia asteroides]UGT62630.1 hypothetical protein LTT61_04595 [Nocardia asteroides]